MGDSEDFGELYADLEDRVITRVPALEAEGDKNELVEKVDGYENDTIESCSSDTEDDLQIVLNEEDYSNKPAFQLITAGRVCKENEGDDLAVATGADCSRIQLKISELGHSVDGFLRGNRNRRNAPKEAHWNSLISYLSGSALHSWNSFSGRGHWDHLAVPNSFGNASFNLGFPTAFPNGCDFYLPRNRSIFDIDFESFECKPWRYNGVDITDYFNFGLDEEGWMAYCKQLANFHQNNLLVHRSSKFNQPTDTVSGEVAQHGHDNRPKVLDYHQNEKKGIRMPRGRAIHVESVYGDRIPSIDLRRPRNQDSDVVIQITAGHAVEDSLDPIKDQITHVDGNVSKSEILSNSSNELCKSSFSMVICAHKCEGSTNPSESPHPFMVKPFDEKLDKVKFCCGSPSSEMYLTKRDAVVADYYSSSSNPSDHNESFKTSRDDANLVKFPSSECIRLNSDFWFQESVLSDGYQSNETGCDTGKINRSTCGVDYPKSLIDLNYSQPATPSKVFKLNLSSDVGAAFPPLHRSKTDGKHQRNESDTIVSKCDDKTNEKGYSSRGGKISLRNNFKGKKGKKIKASSFLARLKRCDENPSSVINREKSSTAREEFKMRRDFHVNKRAQNICRIQNDIVNRGYLLSNSRNMFLYDRKDFPITRRVYEHNLMREAHYKTAEAKSGQRERSLYEFRQRPFTEYRESSLNEYRERSLDEYFGNLYEDEESSDKINRVPCNAGALKRFHEFYTNEKTQLADFDSSGRYADNHEGSRLCEGGLHPKLYRDAYVSDGREWHEKDSHNNQEPSLLQSDKRYMNHTGYSYPRETFSRMSNKHFLVSSKNCHKFSSRTGFNLDRGQSAEVRAAYPDSSAYNERRKGSFPLLGHPAKEEVCFRSSPMRYTLYSTVHHQNVQPDMNSFRSQQVFGNHRCKSSGYEFIARSAKDSDSSGRVDCLLDDFVKDRHEQDDRGCREAVNTRLNGWKVKIKGRYTSFGGRRQFDNDHTDLKKFRNLNDTEGCSHHKMKRTSNHLFHEKEIDELEEGQLVEESDTSENAKIKLNHDGRTPAVTSKIDLTDPVQKNKFLGRYDRNYLLETLAKMEKRRERFKDLVLLKKEPEIYGGLQPDTSIKDEIKQQRPLRKRRWCGS